jgi:nicotinamidase-related amidase
MKVKRRKFIGGAALLGATKILQSQTTATVAGADATLGATAIDTTTLARFRSTLPPKRTAVLINDMQNDMLSPDGKFYKRAVEDPASISALIDAVKTLVQAARAAGVPVIFLANTHTTDAMDVSDESLRRYAGTSRKEQITNVPVIEGTRGHKIIDALAPRPDELVITKAGQNIFQYSMLDKVLRVQGLDSFVLTGLSSYSGVLASSFAMQDIGYRYIVPRQCVGGYAADLHDAAMRLLKAQIVELEDLIAYWGIAST